MSKIRFKHSLARLVVFLLIAFLAVVVYIDYSHHWVNIGQGLGLYGYRIFLFEIPLVLLFSLLFYFPRITNPVIRYLLPLVPFVVLYALFDSFYRLLARSPHPSDFQNFTAMFEFAPMMAIASIMILLLIPVSIAASIYCANKVYLPQTLKRSLLSRTVIAGLLGLLLTSNTFVEFQDRQFKYVAWTEEDTIRENGKFSSFIYYANQERKNSRALESFVALNKKNEDFAALYPGELKSKPNIHVIVLESFVDPRLLSGIEIDSAVLAKQLIPYLNQKKYFSHVISPIYGGGTAQAEFELLTGIKAFAKVNQIEFNVMKGGRVDNFVNKLAQNNYQSIATIAPSASFFNSRQAYQSLNFNQVWYLEEQSQFADVSKEGPIFDGDVLDFNLEKIKQLMATSDQPIFNYVLGMYGHMPFRRNKDLRPDIIKLEHPDERVENIANQFYYRTEAIAQYISRLLEMDQAAVIYITSDHLPSILEEKNVNYSLDTKVNISLLIKDGITIDVSGKKYYEIPWFVWDLLQDNRQRPSLKENEMENLYFKILSESISIGQ